MQYINGETKNIFIPTNNFPATPSLKVGDFVEYIGRIINETITANMRKKKVKK